VMLFDPNNLGYDIDTESDAVTIDKKKIYLTADTVERTYGDTTITSPKSGKYTVSLSDDVKDNGFVDADSGYGDELDAITLDQKTAKNKDTALTGKTSGQVTNNAGGDYKWKAKISLNKSNKNYDNISSNYDFVFYSEDNENGTSTGTGDSIVNKAKLTVSLSEIRRTYGNTTPTSGGYNVESSSGWTNGDSDGTSTFSVTKVTEDGGLVENGTKTNDAGEYTWLGSVTSSDSNILNNYEFVIEDGDSIVDRKKVVVESPSDPSNPGTFNGYVYGDTPGGEFPGYTFEERNGKIVLIYNSNEVTNGYTKGNYYYEIIPATPVEDDDDEEEKNAGKKRRFRERKGEVHYVAGGFRIGGFSDAYKAPLRF